MTQYAALIYSRDVDWTLPEYAERDRASTARSARPPAPSSAEAPRSTRPRPPPPCGSRPRVATPLTTDGPYAETKEALTGFYLLECADLDEAVRVAATIPGAWDGAVEVRPVIEFPM